LIKFIYSEKATKVCKISTVDLTGTTLDKSTVEILQNFVAFLEYMNFKNKSRYFCDLCGSQNVQGHPKFWIGKYKPGDLTQGPLKKWTELSQELQLLKIHSRGAPITPWG
jgi:hypothetical protein